MANEAKSPTTMSVNRTYKSTLFIMLFQDKHNLLELYNAVSGKHYTDPGILEINTLENAIYTDKVRKYAEETELPDAVERAIQECIAEGCCRIFWKSTERRRRK